MSTDRIYPVPADLVESAHINDERYAEMYARSIDDSDSFWAEQAEEFIDWFKPWDKVQDWESQCRVQLPRQASRNAT
jgi:acetyl-CoA synthetase